MPENLTRLRLREDNPPISIQRKTANGKLAPVKLVEVPGGRPRPVPQGPYCVSTYASIAATCPNTCPYKSNGCYVDGMAGYTPVGKLDQRAARWRYTGLETNMAEADAIDRLWPMGVPRDGWKGRGRDMRLHVAGDASCTNGARILGQAAGEWGLRGGGAVWTYTHRWREIARSAWGRWVSVLASVETIEDAEDAISRGYAAAITVLYFMTPKAFKVPGTRLRVVPCPAETRNVTCVECRMCFDSEKLLRHGIIIGFAIHGIGRLRAARYLMELNQGRLYEAPLVLKAQ